VSSPYTAGVTISVWDNLGYMGSDRYGIAVDILRNEMAKFDASDVLSYSADPRPWEEKGPNSTITDIFSANLSGDTITWTMNFNDCSGGDCIQTTKLKVFRLQNP